MNPKITRWLSAIVLTLTSVVMCVSPTLAILSYTRSFVINNTDLIGYNGLPIKITTNNSLLIANNYLQSNGLDSKVFDGANALPHMLADNDTYFVADVPTGATQYDFKTNQTVASSFSTVVGVNGYVTTADNASLELGSNFTNNISGYFNTAATYVGTNIVYKSGAYRVYVYAVDTVRVAILNGDNTENKTVDATVTSGYHFIGITADGTNLSLKIDGIPTIYAVDATLTATTSINRSYERKVIYASGLYWVFYSDGTNMVYKTSYDNFVAKTTARAGITDGASFSVNYDGTYISYASMNSSNISYRRGLPSGTGTITWSTVEQTASTGVSGQSHTTQGISIATSSTGKPYIVFGERLTGGALTGTFYVTSSSTTNGTWTTDVGYPLALESPGGFTVSTIGVVALTAGKMYALYEYSSTAKGFLYNGVAWGGAETVNNSVNINIGSLSALNDDVYFVKEKDAPYLIHSFKRTYGVGWDGGTLVATASTTVMPVLSSLNGTALVTYWIDNNSIYASTYNGVSWSTSFIAKTETAIASNDRLSVSQNGGYLAYLTASIAPYALKLLTFSNIGTASSTAFNGTVLDNANNWTWMNAMPYADNISVTVNGTHALWYAPNNIIVGTSLPDRSGQGNTGTITFGTFPLTAVSLGVTTDVPTNIDVTSATLNGALTDMGNFTSMSVYFQWGETTSYGHTTLPATMSAVGAFSANISGLIYSNTYHVRAVATSGGATIYGSDVSFATLGAAGASTTIKVQSSAHVFSNYISTGDYLFVAEVQNTYNDGGNYTLYPSQSPKEYFTIQLIDTDNTTILGATPLQQWGDTPVGIYVNPTQAANLTSGAAYYLRMQANFASNITSQYQLVTSDWKGYDLTKLDNWCIGVAINMQIFNKSSGYTVVLTDGTQEITDVAGGYFTTGIANIAQIRPNLFTTSKQSPSFTLGTSNNTFDNPAAWAAAVGVTLAGDSATLGTPFGMTGRDMLAAVLVFGMLGVVVSGTMALGGFGALGLLLISIPILWLGTYFRIFGVQWVIVLTIIFGILAIRQFWIKTT